MMRTNDDERLISDDAVWLANAPASIGVFGLPEPGQAPGPDEVLDRFAAAGYRGVDLGPVGFFGTGSVLDERLERVGFGLAGGWIDLPFQDDAAFARSLDGYRRTLAVLRDAYRPSGAPAPRPTLACSATPDRAARPGGGPEVRLDPDSWNRLVKNLDTAARIARAEGLTPTFHHHACTYVETVDEIAELLERTDIGLTLDTGHLILGGGDPVGGLRRWAQRVNHLHLKDASRAALRRVLDQGGGIQELWEAGAFVRLGAGDVDVAGVLETILANGYAGWLVVEQDVIPQTDQDRVRMWRDQEANRQALRKWFR